MVSNKSNQELFEDYQRVHFIGLDLKKDHKAFKDLFSHIKYQIKEIDFDILYDFHDVIRTKILRLLLVNKFRKIRVFCKERSLKKKMVSKKVPLKKLKHTTQRYIECLSLDFPIIKGKSLERSININHNRTRKIGIAPFAAHESKIWPLLNYKEVIFHFKNYEFTIFAFGENEIKLTKKEFKNHTNCVLIDQKLNFKKQIQLINELDAFITMDSANMHLGSLTSTNVISIWGPTHPHLGFGPLFNESNIIQIDPKEMPCRPCSIYGKVKSNDSECAKLSMERIKPKMVIQKVEACIINHYRSHSI